MAFEAVEALLCPLFTLSLYLYWRFEVDLQPIPDFSDRSLWYREPVFAGTERGQHYTAGQQYAAIKKMHDHMNIRGHVSHAARIAGALEDDRHR